MSSKDTSNDRKMEFFDPKKLSSPETVQRIKKIVEEKGVEMSNLPQLAGLSKEETDQFFESPGSVPLRVPIAICKALGISLNEASGEETVTID